ncbi:MAG: hypothetical protein ACP5UO_06130 [Thermoplasmata archaeon]
MALSSSDLIFIATIMLLIVTLGVAVVSIMQSRVLARELRITTLTEMFQEMALKENREHRYRVMENRIIASFRKFRNPKNSLQQDVDAFFKGNENSRPAYLEMGFTEEDVRNLYSDARNVAIIYDRMSFLLTRLEASFSNRFKADFYRLWGDDLIIGWEQIGFLVVHIFRKENTDNSPFPERRRYSRYFEHITTEALEYEEYLRARGEETIDLKKIRESAIWVDPRRIGGGGFGFS